MRELRPLAAADAETGASDQCKEVERLQMELSMLSKERVDLLAHIRESGAETSQRDQLSNSSHEVEQLREKLSALEVKMHNVSNHIHGQLHATFDYDEICQAKLDAFRLRYKEALDEIDFMNKKFEAASSKLKDQLASSGLEILNLKKQLAFSRGP
ncbi:hypothetical protein K7X08_020464 [Anisodus acutangulus]|uniref:Uncharacterized protein n=1 Tax=Anisodus acutangulus TaxID=402998 RepID=A0A9Q1RCB5_9SOLA|nr:hypothetical protein K7X08_020464 [Anisodus acutangulus]